MQQEAERKHGVERAGRERRRRREGESERVQREQERHVGHRTAFLRRATSTKLSARGEIISKAGISCAISAVILNFLRHDLTRNVAGKAIYLANVWQIIGRNAAGETASACAAINRRRTNAVKKGRATQAGERRQRQGGQEGTPAPAVGRQHDCRRERQNRAGEKPKVDISTISQEPADVIAPDVR